MDNIEQSFLEKFIENHIKIINSMLIDIKNKYNIQDDNFFDKYQIKKQELIQKENKKSKK